jgi:predicted amidohydrolase YtcJ
MWRFNFSPRHPETDQLTHTPADLILTGGRLLTMQTERRAPATALAVSNGRIIAVGDDRDILQCRGAQTERIDLAGAIVTPGLVDAHTHPLLGIDETRGVDLTSHQTLATVRSALVTEARTIRDGEWLLGWGLNPNVYGNRPVDQAIFDDLGERPAFVTLFDGHSAVANRAGMSRAGLTGQSRDNHHRGVVSNAHGELTGQLLEEEAINLVRSIIPSRTTEQRHQELATLLRAMAATGLTGGHVMDLGPGDLKLLRSMEEAGDLPLRLNLAPWCRPRDEADRIDELIALQSSAGRLWKVSMVKLFMDGTVDGGTAWLKTPDSHGASTTANWDDPAGYTRIVHRLSAAGVQTATHAIGDAAVEHVLDTLARVDNPALVRHRIEHIETLPADQVPRFAQLGVIASMQPTHATDYTRADRQDNWSQRLGERRASRGWFCRELVDSGAVLALGSDWPVAHYDPRAVIAAAQLRRPAGRPDLPPIGLDQALTAVQALRGYTVAPAIASSDEHRAGTIAVGRRADLTVFGDDPTTTPAADVADIPVTLTIVDGTVWRHHN